MKILTSHLSTLNVWQRQLVRHSMKLKIVGVGPGDPNLITVKALNTIKEADLVFTPHSHNDRPSVAEQVFRPYLPNLKTVPLIFPMIHDSSRRDYLLKEQLETVRSKWEKCKNIVLPVIGDSFLYATGSYLYDVFTQLTPNIELELVPGIAAYSLAASATSSFLVMRDEVMSIVPASRDIKKVKKALKNSDTVALYKPYILKNKLREIIIECGPWRKICRIDRAGLPDEVILEGDSALKQAEEYLSIILLWR